MATAGYQSRDRSTLTTRAGGLIADDRRDNRSVGSAAGGVRTARARIQSVDGEVIAARQLTVFGRIGFGEGQLSKRVVRGAAVAIRSDIRTAIEPSFVVWCGSAAAQTKSERQARQKRREDASRLPRDGCVMRRSAE